MPQRAFFEDIVGKIESAYDALGHSMGWRFLNVSKQVLDRNPRVALITANPGGDHQPSDHGTSSCENGCAYLVESWKNRPPGQENLQKQVRALFDTVAHLGCLKKSGAQLIEQSLIGYFIPFRSPRFSQLHNAKQSIVFSRNLWMQIFDFVFPELIITIDPQAFKGMSGIAHDQGGLLKIKRSYPTGWGCCTADLSRYAMRNGSRTIIRLPHLSQYKLFSRRESLVHMQAVLSDALSS